jgi:hypothetical protein
MFSSSMSAATPTIRRGAASARLAASVAAPNCSKFLSVYISRALRAASTRGNIRLATLSLTMTTCSPSRRSFSSKSRPAMIGTPSDPKKPDDTVRSRARGSSSPSAFG